MRHIGLGGLNLLCEGLEVLNAELGTRGGSSAPGSGPRTPTRSTDLFHLFSREELLAHLRNPLLVRPRSRGVPPIQTVELRNRNPIVRPKA